MKEPAVRLTVTAAENIIAALATLIENKCQTYRQSFQKQIDHRSQSHQREKTNYGVQNRVTQKPTYQTEEEYETPRIRRKLLSTIVNGFTTLPYRIL